MSLSNENLSEQNNIPTFHLGLTMAGAVSAGCYSAGVMDYLFEILDLWEKAKNGETGYDKKLIPPHRVVIDAMGGTSAGGMTTMMCGLYALNNKITPMVEPNDENPYEKKNILYDSWVHLDDDTENQRELTFSKLWDTSDIDGKSPKLESMLNSGPIDHIADRAYQYYRKGNLEDHVEKLPSYISKKIEILLSHTLLRGIPLEVDFSTFNNGVNGEVPTHTSYEHALITHYKLNEGKPIDQQKYFWFNPYDYDEIQKMKLSTIATGAFPIGLKFRKFAQGHFSKEYTQNMLKRSIFSDFGTENLDPENKLVFTNLPNCYETITVDGGAVNNEPYGEVLSVVRKRADDINNPNTVEKDINYGLIMIDPFPDMAIPNAPYTMETDLIEAIPSIFGVLRDQSKIKRKEMLDHLSYKYVKGQIYPKRHYYDEHGNRTGTEPYPIASGSFEAFGGFLDVNFRVHDFFLGRDNARNFFRYFFSIPYDETNPNPIHKDWTLEMIQLFGFKNGQDGKIYLPIIPDLKLLDHHELKGQLTPENIQLLKDKAFTLSGDQKMEYTISARPKYDAKALILLEPKIKVRIRKIMHILAKRFTSPRKSDDLGENAQKWIDRYYSKGLWTKIKTAFFNLSMVILYISTKRSIAKSGAETVTQLIIKDLDAKNLLKDPE